MDSFDIEIQGPLTLVEILNPPVGKFQSIPQIGWGGIPGILKFSAGDLKRVRDKSVELLCERL